MQRKSGNTWIVCGIIALVVLCVGGLVAVVGGFGLLAWFRSDSTSGLSLQLSSPGEIRAGEPSKLELTVRNEGSSAVTVDRIELPVSLMKNAQVEAVAPADAGSKNGAFDFTGIRLEGGQSQLFVFAVVPELPGTITGDIRVYTGGDSQPSTVPLDLTVSQAAVQLEPTPVVQTTIVQTPVVQATVVQSESNPPASNGEIAGVPYKAVVQILAMVDMEGELQPGWSGSGTIISPDGLILTNAHVVLSDRYYEVQGLTVALTKKSDEQPEPSYYADVMQVDQALDIAVIKITKDLDGNDVDPAALNLPTVPFGDDGALNLGDPVTILGYPSIGGSTITLTRGEVAGFTSEEGYGNRAFIKTSATISGGNSGGLAANANGEIIGIPTQLGYGGNDQYIDCRVLADTNRDGIVDDSDNCVPTGGFINALRPLRLAKPLIEAAERGEINIKEGVEGEQGNIPEEDSAQVIYSDDFSDPNSGWDDDAWEDAEVHYVDGEYQMTVKPENWLVWSYLGNEYDDLIISVDTRVVNPTGVGDYGVICRFQDDSNYYAFEVSEDGYFSIWKTVDGENSMLYDWEYSDSIPLDEPFTITAACVGNRLAFGVDDVLLADITDDFLTTGQAGLLAGTLDTGSLTVAFDNFVIMEP